MKYIPILLFILLMAFVLWSTHSSDQKKHKCLEEGGQIIYGYNSWFEGCYK